MKMRKYAVAAGGGGGGCDCANAVFSIDTRVD